MKGYVTLTRISLTTTSIVALVNLLVLLEVFALSTDQLAGISAFLLALGTAVHAWFNPDFGLVGEAHDPTLPPSS